MLGLVHVGLVRTLDLGGLALVEEQLEHLGVGRHIFKRERTPLQGRAQGDHEQYGLLVSCNEGHGNVRHVLSYPKHRIGEGIHRYVVCLKQRCHSHFVTLKSQVHVIQVHFIAPENEGQNIADLVVLGFWHRIVDLEHEVGPQLFERASVGIDLEGQLFHDGVEDVGECAIAVECALETRTHDGEYHWNGKYQVCRRRKVDDRRKHEGPSIGIVAL